MKVILLQDVAKVGRKFDVITIADGYAMNFLIPRKLAEVATPDKVASLEKRKASSAAQAAASAAELEELAAKLDGERIEIAARANEKGHLYKGVGVREIIEAIGKKHKVILPSELVNLEEPIKATGEHTIAIVSGTSKAVVTVVVVAV